MSRFSLLNTRVLQLIAVLEKHRSVLGYSLQDLKGISPALCTHRIPIEPNATPSRELQRRLNNAMREVVKKEVLKLLHAGIIYPIPNSEWVSPVQVVPKKGGRAYPTTNYHGMEDVHRLLKTQQGYKERSLPITLHR